MKYFAGFAVVSALTACSTALDRRVDHVAPPSPDGVPTLSVPTLSGPSLPGPIVSMAEVVCHVGRDEGPVVAERGIGGTGAPSASGAEDKVADRGIGGTGIVGVVTGFASVCVNGLEVHYDKAAFVDINGTASPIAALRAGQVVVIEAGGTPDNLRARSIAVRTEVAGQVENIEPVSGTLHIAGQAVAVPADVWGRHDVRAGDWVAVSGLRRNDGMIVASRLDNAPPDRFMVHGPVVHRDGIARIGELQLEGADAKGLMDGQLVTASGRHVAGDRQVIQVASHSVLAQPNAGGSMIGRYVIQAFVHAGDAFVTFDGRALPIAAGVRAQVDLDGFAVVSLRRQENGDFVADDLTYRDYHGLSARGARKPDAAPPAAPHHAVPATPAVPAQTTGAGAPVQTNGAGAPVQTSGAGAPVPMAVAPDLANAGDQASVRDLPPVELSSPVMAAPPSQAPVPAPGASEAAQVVPTETPAAAAGTESSTASHDVGVPPQPDTSGLISSNPAPAAGTATASNNPTRQGHVVRLSRASRKIITNGSIPPPTITLSNEGIAGTGGAKGQATPDGKTPAGRGGR